MERELATLDESTLNSSSSEEIKKLFLNQETKSNESQSNETTKTETIEETTVKSNEENAPEKNAEEKLQVNQESESTEKVDVTKDRSIEDINYLKQQNQELLSLLKNQTNINIPKPEKKQLTPEEKLEAFTADPDSYVQRKIDEILKPQQEKLRKLEEDQVFNIARNVSQDFKRLEPVIKKLMTNNPDYISPHVEPMKRLEGYYLLAEGLESKYLREKASEKELAKKNEQSKAKKSASSLPEPTRKTESKPEKSIDQMSSKELSQLIAKFKG